MIKDYEKNGYLILKNVFSEGELQQLREVVARFHKSWTLENSKFYADKAVNSAYLTAKKHLIDSDRELLFQFIGSAKLMNIVMSIMGANAAFMNTQLFFDPVNEGQKNYWHRDSQYHLSIDEQKEALLGPNVMQSETALPMHICTERCSPLRQDSVRVQIDTICTELPFSLESTRTTELARFINLGV